MTSAPCSINSRRISRFPQDEARCKGVDWFSSCAVTSTPCSINRRTVSAFPLDSPENSPTRPKSCSLTSTPHFPGQQREVVGLTQDDARCNGVLWLPSSTVTSAPCSINRRTVLECPENDARCKGVLWLPSCAVTPAPCSINNRTVSALPEDDARCKGVEWNSF
ncbi:hypothetical protein EDB85DRAFT_242694 [Lactarius pseudohatsudake]|nr:hypothetical protein EDB85DRAFT_242694 [Lactarius pseudohatsudake]